MLMHSFLFLRNSVFRTMFNNHCLFCRPAHLRCGAFVHLPPFLRSPAMSRTFAVLHIAFFIVNIKMPLLRCLSISCTSANGCLHREGFAGHPASCNTLNRVDVLQHAAEPQLPASPPPTPTARPPLPRLACGSCRTACCARPCPSVPIAPRDPCTRGRPLLPLSSTPLALCGPCLLGSYCAKKELTKA